MGNQYKEWTKEEIIKAIQDFYSKKGKTPRSNDFLRKNGLPSYTYTLDILDCKYIEDVINLCDLKRTEAEVNNKIDKQFGLDKLKEYTKLLGRIPTRKEFESNNWEPWHGWYGRNFGTFKRACYEAGLIEIPIEKEERINISINELIKLANTLNKCPTVAEYESIKHRGYQRRDLEKHLKMKYNDICRKYISQYKLNNDMDVSKETIFKDMKDMLVRNGRAMTFDEMKEQGLHYSYSIFESKCNMLFNDIILHLGYIPIGTTTSTRTRDEMLDDFNKLFIKLNRIPTVKDLDKNNGETSNWSTYIRHFDSIENICKILNIDYDKYYINKSPGKSCLDKNGGKCRSFMECIITNYYIDNNITYEKEPSYSDFIENDTRRLDWKLTVNNKDYWVEFAGMYYPNKMYSHINEKYVKKIDNKIKDLKGVGRYEECLFIFPEDIKTKTLKEIFEPFLGIELEENKNGYNITIVEYFNKTDKELLDIIMKHSISPSILPSTSIISKKEGGAYDEIRKRFKTYNNFAQYFGMTTMCPPKANK